MTSLSMPKLLAALEALENPRPGKTLIRYVTWHPRAWYRPKWCERWIMGSVVLRAGQLTLTDPRPFSERWAFLPPPNAHAIEVLQFPGVE